MTETTLLSPDEFARAMEQHYIEASDDARKVIVGVQDQSNDAEIYARYAHLYTVEQLSALAEARDGATDPAERETLRRLWFDAADAVSAQDLVQAAQDLTNERLAWRTTWDGQQASINDLNAKLTAESDYDRREQIYERICEADEHFAARDLELAVHSSQIRSDVFGYDGEVAIANARTGIDISRFSDDVQRVAAETSELYDTACDTSFPELLGRDVTLPSRAHAGWIRSLHEFDSIYTRERMVDVCNATLAEIGFPLDRIPTILPDLEDRPQKDPRACVIPTRVPEEVHLVVRPTGGLTDYQAFLHEAGHALHYGLADSTLPFTMRYTSPDHALTEIYSYVVERITHNPIWHMRHFGVDEATAQRVCALTRFVDHSLFRRYGAKLAYEIEFWANPADPRNPERYAMLLSHATNMGYPTSSFVSDMDPGLYAADYLRAWRTSEQVIAWMTAEFGEEWFCNGQAAPFLRDLFHQGTGPTNEQVLAQVNAEPTDFTALIAAIEQ